MNINKILQGIDNLKVKGNLDLDSSVSKFEEGMNKRELYWK